MKNINSTSLMKKYYRCFDDIETHPDAWAYVIVGGRHTGKTYGALLEMYKQKKKFIFIKRTNDDVKMLCSKGQRDGMNVDIAPFKSINRDIGTNIQAFPIDKGLGGFYPCEDGDIAGEIIGYIMSLNAAGKYKGSDFSECDYLIFDEFIPQAWERVGRKEGEQLLDLYGTVSRDRVLRGRGELKLICLANATNVYNPTCAALSIVDDISLLNTRQSNNISVSMYDDERQIFIRLLPTPEEMLTHERTTGFYKAMHDTQWGSMAWDNSFAFNDFSCVGRKALKGYKPLYSILWKKTIYYIYCNESGKYYMTTSKSNADISHYNLNLEKDIRRFYYEHVIDLLNITTNGNMQFENYTMYDMIYNYKLRFKFT